MKLISAVLLTIILFLASRSPSLAEPLDFDVPRGHFFKQANGRGGAGELGFAVLDDAVPFWSEFQKPRRHRYPRGETK